ncbi:MAG: DUF4124 domain-containing protein [Magnetococcales bacterium]|nr:DUF4124 domain-containing protein [Magnetococcales bacterium]
MTICRYTLFALMGGCLLAVEASADIYECQDRNGNTIMRNAPCQKNETVQYHKVTAPVSPPAMSQPAAPVPGAIQPVPSTGMGSAAVAPTGAPAAPNALKTGALGDMQNKIMEAVVADPTLLQRVMDQQGKGAFKDLEKDQELKNAMQTGNISALMANPRFRAILEEPIVQEIKQKTGMGQ